MNRNVSNDTSTATVTRSVLPKIGNDNGRNNDSRAQSRGSPKQSEQPTPDDTEKILQSSVGKAKLIGDTDMLEKSLCALCRYYSNTAGKSQQALEGFRKLLQLQIEIYGCHKLKYSQVEEYFECLEIAERDEERVDVLIQLVAAREAYYGTGHPKLLTFSELMFDAQLRVGDIKQASKTATRLLRIREQCFSQDPEESARSLWESARICLANDDPTTAESNCNKALQIISQFDDVLSLRKFIGRNRSRRPVNEASIHRMRFLEAEVIATLALSLERSGWAPHAEAKYFTAQNMFKKTLGENSVRYSKHVMSTVSFLTLNLHFNKAEDMLLDLLRILGAKANSSRNPLFMRAKARLGWLQIRQTKIEEGVFNMLEGIKLCRLQFGEHCSEVSFLLRGCGWFHEQLLHPTMQQLKFAQRLFEEALDIEHEIMEISSSNQSSNTNSTTTSTPTTINKTRAAARDKIKYGWFKTVRGLGILHLRTGELVEAHRYLSIYKEFLCRHLDLDQADAAVRAVVGLARLEAMHEMYERAEDTLLLAMKVMVQDHRVDSSKETLQYRQKIAEIKSLMFDVRQRKPIKLSGGFAERPLRPCHGPKCSRREAVPNEFHTYLDNGLMHFCCIKCRDEYIAAEKQAHRFSELPLHLLFKIIKYLVEQPYWGTLARVDNRLWRLVSKERMGLDLTQYHKISSSALRSLCEKSVNLRKIYFPDIQIVEDPVMMAIGSNCPLLQVLIVRGNGWLTDDGILAVAEGCPKLVEFDLSWCEMVSDEGLHSIAQYLRQLKILKLMGCFLLTEVGVELIAAQCNKLQHLDISYCSKVTDRALFAIRRGCTELQYLGLRGNTNLTDSALARIKAAVPVIDLD